MPNRTGRSLSSLWRMEPLGSALIGVRSFFSVVRTPQPRVWGLILGGAGQAGPWKGCLVSAWVPDPLDPRPESGWGCHAGFGAGKRLVTQPRPVKCVGLSPSPHRRRPQRCCFSATALAAPCPHGPRRLCAVLAVLSWSLPAPPPSLSLAPGQEPPPREFPGRPSGLPPWEPGQRASSQAPWSS